MRNLFVISGIFPLNCYENLHNKIFSNSTTEDIDKILNNLFVKFENGISLYERKQLKSRYSSIYFVGLLIDKNHVEELSQITQASNKPFHFQRNVWKVNKILETPNKMKNTDKNHGNVF